MSVSGVVAGVGVVEGGLVTVGVEGALAGVGAPVGELVGAGLTGAIVVGIGGSGPTAGVPVVVGAAVVVSVGEGEAGVGATSTMVTSLVEPATETLVAVTGTRSLLEGGVVVKA